MARGLNLCNYIGTIMARELNFLAKKKLRSLKIKVQKNSFASYLPIANALDLIHYFSHIPICLHI